MDKAIKITSLEAENVKRIRAVKVEPTAAGLTIIGGDNNQGKTSVLDALAWALGGDRFRPSQAAREGSASPPHLKVMSKMTPKARWPRR
ncbi:ATP-binding protein [uncultured Agathobaculum sp.]|uniref:AAA family ATPase n=1 Tax=uncultured Agathobaculum sp. TaxID=2048140 RepID=UPI00320A7B68